MAVVADPATIAAVQDILKEVWTTDALQSQLLEDTVLLDWMDDVTEFTDSDGLKASVPLRTGRTGGIGSRGIGDTLPVAGHQRVAKATYNYTFHYLVIKVLGPVMARMKTQRQAVIKELDLEVQNGMEDVKQDFQRQMHGDGTGQICTVAASAATTTVTVQGAAGTATFRKGQQALEVGWIYEGMRIGIGTAANPVLASGADGVVVQTVNPDAGTFTVDVAITCTAGHFITRYGNRVATGGGTSYELNGLANLIDDTGIVGGIDSSSANYWKAKVSDNSGTLRANSIDLMLRLENKIRVAGGKTEVLVGDLDQERRYYNVLESKVRFVGSRSAIGAGGTKGLEFNDKVFVGDAHARPNKIDFLNKKSIQVFSAGEMAWQNQTTGGDILAWVQTEDAFVARAAKYFQVGTGRRNSLGSLQDLDHA
jgi:hypothetical protein